MMRFVVRLDALLAASRPLRRWLAEVPVVCFGVHFTPDRLAALLTGCIARCQEPRPDLQTQRRMARECGVGVARVVCAWAGGELVRPSAPPGELVEVRGPPPTERG